jgi:hypothetical protein
MTAGERPETRCRPGGKTTEKTPRAPDADRHPDQTGQESRSASYGAAPSVIVMVSIESPDGTGSHRLVIGSDAGPFTDPDGFAWEAAPL